MQTHGDDDDQMQALVQKHDDVLTNRNVRRHMTNMTTNVVLVQRHDEDAYQHRLCAQAHEVEDGHNVARVQKTRVDIMCLLFAGAWAERNSVCRAICSSCTPFKKTVRH